MSNPVPHCPALVLVRDRWRACAEPIRDDGKHCMSCRKQRQRAIDAHLDWDAQQLKLGGQLWGAGR